VRFRSWYLLQATSGTTRKLRSCFFGSYRRGERSNEKGARLGGARSGCTWPVEKGGWRAMRQLGKDERAESMGRQYLVL
jgi:hypothetical protein